MICDANILKKNSVTASVQNTARITVIQFPILSTQDEKYTADSPRVRPYSNKILSNFLPNGLHSADMMMCVVITKIYRLVTTFVNVLDHIVISKLPLQFGLDSFSSCADGWLRCFLFFCLVFFLFFQ